MGYWISDEEDELLREMQHVDVVLYHCLRRHMDKATGIVGGPVHRISYLMLINALSTPAVPGSHTPAFRPTIKAVRCGLERLARRKLIESRSSDRLLVFYCPAAMTGLVRPAEEGQRKGRGERQTVYEGGSRQEGQTVSRQERQVSSVKITPLPSGRGVSGRAANPTPAPSTADEVIACPFDQILALYHELLPASTRVKSWTPKRRDLLQARWADGLRPNCAHNGRYATEADGLAWWRRFFEHCATSRLLTGKVPGKNGRAPFTADLTWLLDEERFIEVIEGKFHDPA